MSKFFKVTEETKATKWIKDFGCIGIAINVIGGEPEMVINKTGGIWSLTEKRVQVDPYKKTEMGRVVEVNLYDPVQNELSRISMWHKLKEVINEILMDSGFKREMTDREEEFINDAFFDSFLVEDED